MKKVMDFDRDLEEFTGGIPDQVDVLEIEIIKKEDVAIAGQ